MSFVQMIEKIKKRCSEGRINTNLYMRWDRMYHSCHKICVAINNMPNSKQYSLHFREVEIFGAKCCVFDIEKCNSGRNQPSCNVTECDQSPKTKKMRTDVHGTCCTSTPSDILSSGNAEEDVEGSLTAGSSIDNTQDSTRGSNVKGTF